MEFAVSSINLDICIFPFGTRLCISIKQIYPCEFPDYVVLYLVVVLGEGQSRFMNMSLTFT